MTWSRVKCLLSGGHRRIPDLPPPESWKTLVFTFGDKIPTVPAGRLLVLEYEPCAKCGELFLNRREFVTGAALPERKVDLPATLPVEAYP